MKCYEIPGTPIPWKRARRHGNRYYDPQAKQKEGLRTLVKSVEKAVLRPNKGFAVFYEFNMPFPKNMSKKRRLNAKHVTTPDLDNLVKFVNDTFNGILWDDDKLIFEMYATKQYSDNPSTKIIVTEVDDGKN